MRECSKSIQRRLHTPGFANRYFVGHGIDIGGKPDPLGMYKLLFSRMESCRTWDLEDGDAQIMAGVSDCKYDFVHSSHCLEHMREPEQALTAWLRILKPGGHLVGIVPDEDMYEQGQWPSRFNTDHRWTFTICKKTSWSPCSRNLMDLLADLSFTASVISIVRLQDTWLPIDALYDQTIMPVAECGIEFILRKHLTNDSLQEPDREMRIHLNQYAADRGAIISGNSQMPPFGNDSPLQRKKL